MSNIVTIISIIAGVLQFVTIIYYMKKKIDITYPQYLRLYVPYMMLTCANIILFLDTVRIYKIILIFIIMTRAIYITAQTKLWMGCDDPDYVRFTIPKDILWGIGLLAINIGTLII